MRSSWMLIPVLLLSGCSIDPSKHSNLGPPQVVISAYDLAIKGDLAGTQKFFSASVQNAMKNPETPPAKVWEPRLLQGHVKGINVSNKKDAGKDRYIIEGHVVLDTGQIQEIEELIIKENGLWVIDGLRPHYSPGMPDGLTGGQ